jgi:septal ring factor EnvC (AmiA/AmiB activator)
MTNADGYKARLGSPSLDMGASEEIARNKILQLIRTPTPSVEEPTAAPGTDAEFQKLKSSLNLGAAKLRELANRNRSETIATEQAINALRRELQEERARFDRLKKDFETANEEHRRLLATAERRIIELDSSNKSLAASLESSNRELAKLRHWFFNLSTDAEAIRNAIEEVDHLGE